MQYLTVSTPDADGNTLTPPPASPGGNSETRHRRVSIASTPPTVAPEVDLKSRKYSTVSGPEERRKSILHNPMDSVSVHSNFSHGSPNASSPNHHDAENGKPTLNNDGLPMKKFSMTEVQNSKPRYSFSELEKSWWFLLCQRCHQPETEPSWQPPGWNRMCPRHFCPSYRQFARMVALVLIILLCWGTVYAIMGRDAAPGGQLFNLAILTLAAHCGGWVARVVNLPSLVGMLLVGILLQNVGVVHIEDNYLEVVADLRRIALVIILTRAGLEMDPPALRRLMVTVLKLGLVPWVVECVVIAVTSHFLLGLPWIWGFLLGSIVAAVSPAVVVPCLFRLRTKGYGVAKGIPTLIIAVSGIDDATSVAIFGIIKSIMFSADSLAYQIIQGPLSIIGGIGFGIVWGILSKFIPEKDDPYVVPLRIMMLLGGGLIAVFGSDVIGFGGAGPLGCVTAAFVSCVCWTQQGWNIEDNPVATAFEIFWMIFEPILFGITGTQIKINELGGHDVYLTLACLIIGIVLRIFSTTLVAIGCRLNLKEKFFVSFSWMAKATVQAALGPVALDAVRQRSTKSDADSDYANKVLMMCVLSILVTAPLGAIIITLTGPRLLTKTSIIPPDGWRRSARPSLRDISIIDEEENDYEENTAQS